MAKKICKQSTHAIEMKQTEQQAHARWGDCRWPHAQPRASHRRPPTGMAAGRSASRPYSTAVFALCTLDLSAERLQRPTPPLQSSASARAASGRRASSSLQHGRGAPPAPMVAAVRQAGAGAVGRNTRDSFFFCKITFVLTRSSAMLYTGRRVRVGPMSIGGWVCEVGEKKFVFGRNTLQIVIFLVLQSFHSIHFEKQMTGGSDVRGKVGPIWVRKVFNCFHSL
jgi:hypothetical protein